MDPRYLAILHRCSVVVLCCACFDLSIKRVMESKGRGKSRLDKAEQKASRMRIEADVEQATVIERGQPKRFQRRKR
jgi:hypothetical protein